MAIDIVKKTMRKFGRTASAISRMANSCVRSTIVTASTSRVMIRVHVPHASQI